MRLIQFCVVIFGVLGLVSCDYTTEFMTNLCNADTGSRVSGRLETSRSLTYQNNMDCYTTIRVQEGRRIMLHFNRFDVEPDLDGSCVDYLQIYDGGSTSGSLLTSSPLCGTISAYFNVSSSSNALTLHFVSDNNAVFRGFEIVFTEFQFAPCGDADYACNNSLCIASAGDCNDLNECGDRSDEDHCTDEYLEEIDEDEFPWGLLIGCIVLGILLVIVIAIVAYKVHDYYYWKRWLERNHLKASASEQRVLMYQYPVTDKYSQYQVHEKRGRRKPDVDPLFLGELAGNDQAGKFLDEY